MTPVTPSSVALEACRLLVAARVETEEGMSTDIDMLDEALAKARAALAERTQQEANSTAPMQPSGWRFVPVEPTQEMVSAYLKANDAYWKRTDELPTKNASRWREGKPNEATAESYRAMLDAAPTQAAPAAENIATLHPAPESSHPDCRHGCSHPARSIAGPCTNRCVKTEAFHEQSSRDAKAAQTRFATQIGANVLTAAPAAQTFIEYTPDEDGFSEWVCPTPKGYLMKCCDCGLVHEAEFRVAKYEPRPSEEFAIAEDPDLQAQFRMRRAAAPTQAPMQPSDERIDELLQDHAKGSREMHDFARSVLALAEPTQAAGGEASSITIDFRQATELLEMFGDEPTEITLMTGDGHSGNGLYAVYNADPEGSVYLGQTDEEAAPDAAPAAAVEPTPCATCSGRGVVARSFRDGDEYDACPECNMPDPERAAAAPEGLTVNSKQAESIARQYCGGLDTRWSFSDFGLRLMLQQCADWASRRPATPDAKTAEERKPVKLAALAHEHCFKAYEMPSAGDQLYMFNIDRLQKLIAAHGIGDQP